MLDVTLNRDEKARFARLAASCTAGKRKDDRFPEFIGYDRRGDASYIAEAISEQYKVRFSVVDSESGAFLCDSGSCFDDGMKFDEKIKEIKSFYAATEVVA